ncbi:TIGR04086 family membrane protein [Anaerocolumna sedimenticola]|uniref:TIGR04086 family membrane protein n=1 Tax=Anaerocolumna sedimenticola TaxID=2696063 RepID=A0A6P1TJ89_9FIRM|nr:TIGR04086 family membrane protein [Anaerocolumna sedimenticola]QHQ61194.1 TIGR04086 family membrane protein [Anaerocolumna sedimenticola]
MDKVLHRNSKVVVILRDLLISYMVTGILLLLLAFFMLKADLSGGILNGGILLTYVLSSFAGGFLLGKSADQKRFLWGLGMGALYFIMLVLISILTNSVMGMEASRVITVMVICLFSGMLGGMIS